MNMEHFPFPLYSLAFICLYVFTYGSPNSAEGIWAATRSDSTPTGLAVFSVRVQE